MHLTIPSKMASTSKKNASTKANIGLFLNLRNILSLQRKTVNPFFSFVMLHFRITRPAVSDVTLRPITKRFPATVQPQLILGRPNWPSSNYGFRTSCPWCPSFSNESEKTAEAGFAILWNIIPAGRSYSEGEFVKKKTSVTFWHCWIRTTKTSKGGQPTPSVTALGLEARFRAELRHQQASGGSK